MRGVEDWRYGGHGEDKGNMVIGEGDSHGERDKSRKKKAHRGLRVEVPRAKLSKTHCIKLKPKWCVQP
ncbi:unnamed protein product [Cuscuta campestris]|uniref:Uncharacterized protein n=1 Tax=Cuscuta campestris TaxID=132261 RepID=A0A484LFU0_9ASTE|nr:unnamed protein product [Cuscuta campestris]